MPRRITPQSSLETLRQEAKDWLRRLRANDHEARARFNRALPDGPPEPTLRDVQHAVARELGFAGWTAVKARSSTHPGSPSSEPIARYEQMATRLLDAYRTGAPDAMEAHWRDTWHRRSWDAMRRYVQLDLGKRPESADGEGPADQSLALEITEADARWLIAREQGFETWDALVASASELIAVEGVTALRGVQLVVHSSTVDGESGASTRRWDDVFDALEDEEAIGIDAHGQMTDALLERVAHYEHVSILRLQDSALTDDGLRHLARLPNLRVLDLSNCAGLTDAGFATLGALSSLERIRLNSTQITDAGAVALARCDRLERVDLGWTRTGDGALRALRGKARLAQLDTGVLVTEAGVAHLHEFPVFKTWQGGDLTLELTAPRAGPNFLHLRGNITDACLARMVGLDGLFGLNIDDPRLPITPSGLASLVRLPRLGMLSIDAVDESMPYVAAMPALRSLMCQDTTASDDGWIALSRSRTLEQLWGRRCHGLRGRGFEALAMLPALRALSVSCLNVPDESIATLSTFPALRELMPMDVPDEGYRHIAECKGLERLVLMYCRNTTDAATEHVARMSALEYYFASYTLITDRTPELLATMPSLETIELQGCAGVTDIGVAALRKAPRLRSLSLGGMQQVTRQSIVAFPERITVKLTV